MARYMVPEDFTMAYFRTGKFWPPVDGVVEIPDSCTEEIELAKQMPDMVLITEDTTAGVAEVADNPPPVAAEADRLGGTVGATETTTGTAHTWTGSETQAQEDLA